MKVVYVYPDMNDNTMALPELILPLLNADFDGDVLNIHSLKIDDIKNEYYEKLNPMYNVFISRNDGKYEIFKEKGHIAIDCGCVYGGKLCAYCFETEEAFYVP